MREHIEGPPPDYAQLSLQLARGRLQRYKVRIQNAQLVENILHYLQLVSFQAAGSMKPIASNDRIKPSDLILTRPRSSRGRLEGWPQARSCLWPSFETRTRARSSGRGLMDDTDMTQIMETLY